jgi:hypothetical protein
VVNEALRMPELRGKIWTWLHEARSVMTGDDKYVLRCQPVHLDASTALRARGWLFAPPCHLSKHELSFEVEFVLNHVWVEADGWGDLQGGSARRMKWGS